MDLNNSEIPTLSAMVLKDRVILILLTKLKNLRKGKTTEQIAEDLDEDIVEIRNICEAAEAFAPAYDAEQVLRKVMEAAEGMGDVGFMEYDEFAAKYGDPFPEFHKLTEAEIRECENRLM